MRGSVPAVELRLQRLGAWSGSVMILLYGTAFSGLAQLFPPLSPTDSPTEIAGFIVEHKVMMRFGIAAALLSAVIALPFLAVVVLRIRRAEGRWGMLSLTQLFAATIFVPALIFPLIVLAAAAFRPEQRSPEVTQALNDVFWLMFIGIVGTIVVQNITLAAAAFVDDSDPPTFPRWYGYFNLWVATLSLPGALVVVFNDGPLAWNGVFAFYIPGIVLVLWIFVTSYVMLRGIGAQQRGEESPVSPL